MNNTDYSCTDNTIMALRQGQMWKFQLFVLKGLIHPRKLKKSAWAQGDGENP